MDLDAVLPIATLIFGAAATHVTEAFRHRRARRETLQDSLRKQRAETYILFLNAAHTAAHRLGRSAVGCPNPLTMDPDVYWLTDSDVTQRLRNLQIVGGEAVVERALQVRQALLEFRRAVESGVAYDSTEYWAAYRPVAQGRDELIAAAREEINVLA